MFLLTLFLVLKAAVEGEKELATMKQIIFTLRGKGCEQNLPQSRIGVKSATGKQSIPLVKLLPEHEEENIFTPKPTLFTNKEVPVWYKKLKKKTSA
ncbi:hypothetical protein EK904_003183 [Melospiza melodia maxima]|nr:hypothetical protein EK904_003183 [Melospiza melodia maxima]